MATTVLFEHTGISPCYHTSLLLTANLLYKAALQEVAAMQESGGSSDETEEHAGFNPNAPHPYQLALGVLCVQKVLHVFNVVCSEDSLSTRPSLLPV